MKWPKREMWKEICSHFWEKFLDTVVPRRRLNQRFLAAIAQMKPEELAGWLARGADPNAHTQGCGWCALGAAARSPFTEAALVAQLLSAGANVNPANSYSPLLQAAHQSTDAKITLLLQAGADATMVDERYERSVVSELAPWALPATIQLALERGAGLAVGFPLHQAVWAGRPELIVLFLKRGVSANLRGGREPLTPLELAQKLQEPPQGYPKHSPALVAKMISLLSGEGG